MVEVENARPANADQIIQCKIKVDRRKSAASMKVKLQSKRGVTISEQMVGKRLHEVNLLGHVARKKNIWQ